MEERLASRDIGVQRRQVAPERIRRAEIRGGIEDPAGPGGLLRRIRHSMVEEMVDLISSSRTYEANVTVLNAAKQMAKRALEI